jgi:hypothetical protein
LQIKRGKGKMSISKRFSRVFIITIVGLLLISITTVAFNSNLAALGSGENWLTGWSYRKSHVIDGTGTTAGTNYPVEINVYYMNYTSLGSVTTKAPMPTGLSDLPAVSYDNKIYTFGGYRTSGGDSRNSVYSYDPATDTWASMTSMTYARWGAAAAVYDGIAYVFGGSPSYVEAYNIGSNSWTTKNSLPGPISAQGLMAVTVGTKIYLFCYQYAYQYDPSADTYTALTNLPTGYSLTWGTCAYVNVGGEDRIYIIGGYNYAVGGGGTNAVLYYRPANNDWTQPSTNAPYAAYGTTRDNPVINGKIYYGYGNSQTSAFFYASMYAYDPAANSWTQLTSGAYPRDGGANGVVNGKLYVIGGREVEGSPYGVNYNECFDPSEVTPIVDNGQAVTANMKCRTDFGDIRFTASDGATQLNYWIQSSSTGVMATFWVKITDNLSGASSTIYLYYGNPSATTTSNGAAVWTLYDDFEGTNPLNNYNAEIGANSSFVIAAVGSNHVLSYVGGAAWFLFSRTTPTFQDMRIIVTMMPHVSSANYYTGLSFRETASTTWYFSWLAYEGSGGYAGSPTGPRNDWDRRVGGVDTYIAGGSTADLHNTWATMEVDMAGSSCKTYVNGVKKADATNTAITGAGKIGFMGLYASYWDNLYVGSYVNPEPAHGSWGAEQQSNPTLTLNITGSGVINLNNSGPYNYGEVVQLTAVPTDGWSFDNWSGDLIGSTSPTTVTMTRDMTVTATFTQNTYSLTTSVDGNGSIIRNQSAPYHYGDLVQFTAVPDIGWSFDHWTGDLTGSTSPTTLAITGNAAVTAYFVLPQLYIDPSPILKGPSDTFTTFQANVMVNKITDLRGFDFKLTWDSNLIMLNNVDFNTTLDNIWGSGNWYLAYNVSGLSYYELAAVSTSTSLTCTTATPLATLTFVVKAAVGQASLHFAVVKLSDSQAQTIQAEVTDGTYTITGPQYLPVLQMTPSTVTCKKYHEYFTVQVNVTNAITVDAFSFSIYYSPTLMNYVSVTWGELGSGTITNVDPVNGIIEGQVTGTPLTGNRWLLNVTFQDLATMIWRQGQVNEIDGQIWFHYAQLNFSGIQQLTYEEGGLDQISVNNAAFKFIPIQGDITGDGVVDIFDMRAVAAYFDVKQGDPLWSVASAYDLNNNGVIDIFDLVLIGANFS